MKSIFNLDFLRLPIILIYIAVANTSCNISKWGTQLTDEVSDIDKAKEVKENIAIDPDDDENPKAKVKVVSRW